MFLEKNSLRLLLKKVSRSSKLSILSKYTTSFHRWECHKETSEDVVLSFVNNGKILGVEDHNLTDKTKQILRQRVQQSHFNRQICYLNLLIKIYHIAHQKNFQIKFLELIFKSQCEPFKRNQIKILIILNFATDFCIFSSHVHN